jgi:hypothetical protein
MRGILRPILGIEQRHKADKPSLAADCENAMNSLAFPQRKTLQMRHVRLLTSIHVREMKEALDGRI